MKAQVMILLAAWAAVPALAQLPPPNGAGVGMGHLHLNVSNVAAEKHFWMDVLGATPVEAGGMEGARVPGAIVFFLPAAPSGGSAETTVNHIGLKVKRLADYGPRLTSAGIPFDASKNGRQLMITGPDGLRVELTEDPGMEAPIANHHIHLYTTEVPAMQAWYVKTFGAVPGKRAVFEAADLPGVNLSFSPAEKPPLPTKGRALDHIGFEVRDLESFCRRLEAEGVKFDIPFRKATASGISVAFLTDPWGTYIELTEGLDKL